MNPQGMTIKTLQYWLYTSSNTPLFYMNFYLWFSLKLGLSLYYGINVYLLVSGFMMWSFWEYTYHRFMMHGLKHTVYYYKLHGYHHSHPSKPAHIPLFQYILVSPAFFVAAYWINPSYVFSYAVGHMCGLYCFETMHFAIHRDIDRKNISTRYHMYHHAHSNTAFCFTTPCFDILCGTFPKEAFAYNYLGVLPIPYFSFYGITDHGSGTKN